MWTAAKIKREDRAAEAKLTREAKFAKAKHERELAKIDREKGKDKEDRKYKWAEKFVTDMARMTKSDTFSQILAMAIGGEGIDPALVEQGQGEIRPELQPLYDRAIKILSEAYGAPTSEEFTYTR